MRGAFQRFTLKSYEPAFVARLGAAIIGLGILVAGILASVRGGAETHPLSPLHPQLEAITDRRHIPELMAVLRTQLPDALLGTDKAQALLPEMLEAYSGVLTTTERRIIMDGWETMATGDLRLPETISPFSKAAAAEPVSAVLCSVEGMLLAAARRGDEALAAWRRGAADPAAGPECMLEALRYCLREGRREEFKKLYALPGWREAILQQDSPQGSICAAAWDFKGLMIDGLQSLRHSFRSPFMLALALLGGLTWFVVIFRVTGVPFRLWWLGLAGVIAGVFSIALTTAFITLQETHNTLVQSRHQVDALVFWMAGVGLREEAAKLICFLPLLLLLRRRSAAEALATASCVGLGFAVVENMDYIADGGSLLSRHMSANLMHLALTGFAGCAVFCALHWPRHFLQRGLLVLIGAVVIHGAWDWLIAHPDVSNGDKGYVLFFGLAFILIAWMHEARRCRQLVPPGMPAWAAFVYGSALIVATGLVGSAAQDGLRAAVLVNLQPALQSFTVAAVMVWQMRRLSHG